jgi:hypothetical protein
LGLRGRVLELAGCALGEVGLVPLPLRVRQVVPLVVVQRQAEFALVASQRGKQQAESAGGAARIESRNLGFCGGRGGEGREYLPR